MINKRKKGDLIQLHDYKREYLELYGRCVDNPTMEAILAGDPKSGKARMRFGSTPLPWERSLTAQDFRHLNQAQEKQYTCQNPDCPACGKSATAIYYMVTHKKELPHSDTGNTLVDKARNQIDLRRFGKRERICIHVGVRCKTCKQHIKYVKYSLSHRRAAKDQLVSGPHQRTRSSAK